VLASSLQILSVPAAQQLSRELQLINRASGWPFSNPNGVELIRAVNALRLLGKERAIAVLEEHAALTRDFDYLSERDVVFWIIRLLFEPIRVGDRIPIPMVAGYLVTGDGVQALQWPLNPMAVSEDVPFMMGGHPVGWTGQREKPSSHIQWARLHGVIRDDPIVPTANPLAAAQSILESRRFKALDNFCRAVTTTAIRSQALAMVEGLIEQAPAHNLVDDDRWRAALKAATERGIHWDLKREQFVPRQ
jgi:hypothetical protein